MKWLADRLREPSTLAGLSALGVLVGLPPGTVDGVALLVSGGLALAAVVMKEKPNA